MGLRFVGLVLLALFASEARAGVVRLRVGTLAVDGSRYMTDILAMSKEIERRTQRRVRLDWVTGGQLGDDRAMAKQIRDGALAGGGLSETGLAAPTERGIAALSKAGVQLRSFTAGETAAFFEAAAASSGGELVTAIRASLAR
jgi:hypothetical protein